MSFNTPLRYPGGKSKLTNYIKQILRLNNLINGQYIEPYAGGSGIAINLLMDRYISHIHINDINPAIYAFWDSVLHDTENLCRLIRDTDVSIDEWHKQKDIFLDQHDKPTLQLGFATFFLNRTNRSGILHGGVIGGKNQSGIWKLDARYNKVNLIQRIEKIALLKSQIHLYNLDAAYLIHTILPKLPDKTLVYLDPPYYVKGSGLYENHYSHNDHIEIANLVVNKIKLPWIVSYDNTTEINKMYTGMPTFKYGLKYTVQKRYTGSEVMFFSKNLLVPSDIIDPTKLKVA